MKEAAGEANMTVITIILITAIVAIATPLITNVMRNSKAKTCCINAGGDTITGAGNSATCSSAAGATVDDAAFAQCMSDSVQEN